MASLYRRRDSPFLWLKRRAGGKVVSESTGLRWAFPAEARQARARRAAAEVEERATGRMRGDWAWVDGWLTLRYAASPPTLRRARDHWRCLLAFLGEASVHAPAAVTREACLAFAEWRQVKRTGFRRASLNAALQELSFLGLVLDEAIRRQLASTNPARKLGIRKSPPPEKPALTEAQIRRVEKELGRKEWPGWMRVAWIIACAQGCRLRETGIPLDAIDEKRGTITFGKTKTVPFTTALHPRVAALKRELAATGATVTCAVPENASELFAKVFHRLGMKGVTFHSTRVTVVSRLARAGVSQSQAMRFVGHASPTVHRIYQRLGVEDLGACLRALSGSRKP